LLAVKDSHSAAARVSGVDRAYIVRAATVLAQAHAPDLVAGVVGGALASTPPMSKAHPPTATPQRLPSAAATLGVRWRAMSTSEAALQPGEVHRLAATAASPQATPSQRRGAAAVLELLAAEHDELVTGSGDQPGHHRPLAGPMPIPPAVTHLHQILPA
jgi:hypothetical protein